MTNQSVTNTNEADMVMEKHRISSGAIVIDEGKVLLVRHQLTDKYDFWVAPGGGVIGEEDILTAAVREAKEETGFNVEPLKPVYLEQLHQPATHHIKTWILCRLIDGNLSVGAPEATRENIVEARFFSRDDIQKEKRPVFPEVLCDQLWKDYADDFPAFKYLGIRAMEFY